MAAPMPTPPRRYRHAKNQGTLNAMPPRATPPVLQDSDEARRAVELSAIEASAIKEAMCLTMGGAWDAVGLEYATAEGLHVGMLENQVRDVLGEPNRIIMEKDAHLLLYSSGILFDVNDKSGDDYQKVTQIYVRPSNCLKEVPCT